MAHQILTIPNSLQKMLKRQKKKKGNLCKNREGEEHAQPFGVVVCEEVGESCFPFRKLAPRTLSKAQLGSLVSPFDGLDVRVGRVVEEGEVADDFDDGG